MDIFKISTFAEKCTGVLFAFFTLFSVGSDRDTVSPTGKTSLTDVCLLFMHAQVLGRAAAFEKFNKIPIFSRIFMVITALCSLIILQVKGISTVDWLNESGAVLFWRLPPG